MKRYFEHKFCAHCWAQIPLPKCEEISKEGMIFSAVPYTYKNANNENYLQFHVDNHPLFCELEGLETICLCANQRMQKPFLLFDQDKYVYKKYACCYKFWTGPNGDMPLMPKTVSQVVVVSAFVSSEYVFA